MGAAVLRFARGTMFCSQHSVPGPLPAADSDWNINASNASGGPSRMNVRLIRLHKRCIRDKVRNYRGTGHGNHGWACSGTPKRLAYLLTYLLTSGI